MTSEQEPVKTQKPVILAPDGRPARVPADARCPRCGAGPDCREQSGFGPMQDVTCQRCAYDFGKVAV